MCPAVIGVAQSELLNHMSKNWDVLARKNIPITNCYYQNRKSEVIWQVSPNRPDV